MVSYVNKIWKNSSKYTYSILFLQWLDTLVVGWLELWYGENDKDQSASTCIQAHKGRLYHYMYEVFAKV